MTKRLYFTLEEVLDDVLYDDEDLDDPDEPMMDTGVFPGNLVHK